MGYLNSFRMIPRIHMKNGKSQYFPSRAPIYAPPGPTVCTCMSGMSLIAFPFSDPWNLMPPTMHPIAQYCPVRACNSKKSRLDSMYPVSPVWLLPAANNLSCRRQEPSSRDILRIVQVGECCVQAPNAKVDLFKAAKHQKRNLESSQEQTLYIRVGVQNQDDGSQNIMH